MVLVQTNSFSDLYKAERISARPAETSEGKMRKSIIKFGCNQHFDNKGISLNWPHFSDKQEASQIA
jgi:hypothetical protein